MSTTSISSPHDGMITVPVPGNVVRKDVVDSHTLINNVLRIKHKIRLLHHRNLVGQSVVLITPSS